MTEFFGELDGLGIFIVIFAIAVGGLVRGFSGFGAGMIIMPIASTVIDPRLAAATLLVIDSFITLPIVVRSVRICNWKTVLPAVIGAALFVPTGAYILAVAEPLAVRWSITIIATMLLALLLSGWRYKGTPKAPISFGVGVSSGFLGGVSQLAGPPMVAFWLSGPEPPFIIRANLMVFFAFASAMTYIAYAVNGFFTGEVLRLLVLAVPAYGFTIYLGSRGFGKVDPKIYRAAAYSLIALAVISSMPVFDGVLRASGQ
ncbi:sulfite exporter TauE/SafE family protein [Rhizobiales bacterium]|uniref:sulfite exporter TauE/SafE family protein n=1 Tax=Hongsoonwoonella zoysiae TaxID=2821844 RepID=UPI00155FA1F7|nr:sulfite exporter TauE/SafE family protein [Hongsoonwoonella zoysiae]NRG17382.1 sulfite exporter TauE/SafE family protein [Hongsoonwoonella zoysiae]